MPLLDVSVAILPLLFHSVQSVRSVAFSPCKLILNHRPYLLELQVPRKRRLRYDAEMSSTTASSWAPGRSSSDTGAHFGEELTPSPRKRKKKHHRHSNHPQERTKKHRRRSSPSQLPSNHIRTTTYSTSSSVKQLRQGTIIETFNNQQQSSPQQDSTRYTSTTASTTARQPRNLHLRDSSHYIPLDSVHPSVQFVATSDTVIPVPTNQLIQQALKRCRCAKPSTDTTSPPGVLPPWASNNSEPSQSEPPDPEPPPAPNIRELSDFDVEDFGDSYPQHCKDNNHLLVTFQNIGPQPRFFNSDKAQTNIASFCRSRPDIALFAEHDLNRSKLSEGHRFADRQILSVPSTRSYIVNNIHKKDIHSYSQWGGTAWSINEKYTSSICGKSRDPTGLGRWCWVRLRGKHAARATDSVTLFGQSFPRVSSNSWVVRITAWLGSQHFLWPWLH